MIYIGSPYSHPHPLVREARTKIATLYASKLVREGRVVFSPLTHFHFIADFMSEKECLDVDLWLKQDLFFLEKAKELHVLQTDEWEESKGLKREIEFAEKNNIMIKYLSKEDIKRVCSDKKVIEI